MHENTALARDIEAGATTTINDRITTTCAAYMATFLTEEEKQLAAVIATLDGNIVRAHQRHTVDRPHTVAIAGTSRDATLRDISRAGARLGTDCRADATVTDFDDRGSMRLQFANDTVSPGLTPALDLFENKGKPKAA